MSFQGSDGSVAEVGSFFIGESGTVVAALGGSSWRHTEDSGFLSDREVFDLSERAWTVVADEATTFFLLLRRVFLVSCAALVMTGHFAIFQSIEKKLHFRLDERQP